MQPFSFCVQHFATRNRSLSVTCFVFINCSASFTIWSYFAVVLNDTGLNQAVWNGLFYTLQRYNATTSFFHIATLQTLQTLQTRKATRNLLESCSISYFILGFTRLFILAFTSISLWFAVTLCDSDSSSFRYDLNTYQTSLNHRPGSLSLCVITVIASGLYC